jgi:hypothetical protein
MGTVIDAFEPSIAHHLGPRFGPHNRSNANFAGFLVLFSGELEKLEKAGLFVTHCHPKTRRSGSFSSFHWKLSCRSCGLRSTFYRIYGRSFSAPLAFSSPLFTKPERYVVPLLAGSSRICHRNRSLHTHDLQATDRGMLGTKPPIPEKNQM